MNLRINVPQLAQELRLLNQVTPQKATVSIYTTLLLQTIDNGLCLTACDGERLLRTVCRAEVQTAGAAVVSAKRLLDIFERLPADHPAALIAEGQWLSINGAEFRSRLQTRHPDDFIQMPAHIPEQSFDLSTQQFMQLIDRVHYAIDDKGISKYTLNGALLQTRENSCGMVATDGKRLALASMPYVGPEESLLIPSKTLDVLKAVFDTDQIQFATSDNHLFFTNSHRQLISQKIDGKFPAYDRIIPRENQYRALVNRVAWAEALHRVGLVAEEHGGIYLDIGPGKMVLSARCAEVGDASEPVPLEYQGGPVRVCCHWEYLLHFLEVATSQQVAIIFHDNERPLLLQDGENHLAVVMLMRG